MPDPKFYLAFVKIFHNNPFISTLVWMGLAPSSSGTGGDCGESFDGRW